MTSDDQRPSWWAEQDDLLIAIEDNQPLPTHKLQTLPPWRAVLIAHIAAKAGVRLQHGNIDQLHAEAARVGGEGRLGQWWQP